MSFAVGAGCDGCGACRRACPRGAIRRSGDAAIPYEVVSLDCTDCGKCAIVCPRGVLAPDPEWARCWGRGCPLSSSRYEGWACAEGKRRCPGCGNSMWQKPSGDGWICSRCDDGTRVMCPKARKASSEEAAACEQLACRGDAPLPVPVGS